MQIGLGSHSVNGKWSTTRGKIILFLQKEKLKPKESINLGFTFCHYFPIDLCTSCDLILRQLVLDD
jgi:hypothetical protein